MQLTFVLYILFVHLEKTIHSSENNARAQAFWK